MAGDVIDDRRVDIVIDTKMYGPIGAGRRTEPDKAGLLACREKRC